MEPRRVAVTLTACNRGHAVTPLHETFGGSSAGVRIVCAPQRCVTGLDHNYGHAGIPFGRAVTTPRSPTVRYVDRLDRIDPPMTLQIERAGRTDPGEGLDVDAIYQLVESVRAITPAQPAQ